MDRVGVRCPAAVSLQLLAGRQSSVYDVIEVRMDRVGVQCPAAVSLQLLAGWKSSGYDVVEVRMDGVGVQCPAAVSLQLLTGRKCINKSFFLPRDSVINLHNLICLRRVSRVMLRQ